MRIDFNPSLSLTNEKPAEEPEVGQPVSLGFITSIAEE